MKKLIELKHFRNKNRGKMRVKKLRLKNGYKRFENLTIDLGNDPKRIIALVGPNGCGKSSIFDGMLFLNNAFHPLGNKGNKNYEYHSMQRVPNYSHENVEIEFDQGRYNIVLNEKRKIGKENTIFSFRSPYRYNNKLKIVETRATNEIRLNTYGATFSSDLDEKMEENYRRLYAKYYIYLNETNSRPLEAKAKIIGDLNEAIENCLDLKVSDIGNIEASKGTLYFQKPDQLVNFDFNVLSAGEKEVIDILLDLYLRQEEYDDTVFLIDEPELHINTMIQRKLLIEINRLIGEKCQIWIATHSIGFLRALQEEMKNDCQIIYFPPGIEWATTTQILRPINKTRAEWKKIFETALDDLTELISPKRIVYCEGKDRPGLNGTEKGLDAQVFNKIFSEKYADTVFVSSGGNTELDQRSEIAIAILAKVFSDLEILVFKDRDMSSGKLNSEKDRKIYLQNNPENHRVMKRWEIENYLYDKEVLKKYCEMNDLNFDEMEFDKKVIDIENQDVKVLTSFIRSCCNIKSSINPENFKLRLSECISEDMNVYLELENCIFNKE